jgi:hypothetical protein
MNLIKLFKSLEIIHPIIKIKRIQIIQGSHLVHIYNKIKNRIILSIIHKYMEHFQKIMKNLKKV